MRLPCLLKCKIKQKEQMFVKALKYRRGCSIIYIIKNERMFLRTWEVHMSNEEYKQIIMELIQKIEDQQILISIYTVVKNLTE